MLKKSKYKHLLVIRLSAMGDVAMVPHALRALRDEYPELKITVLTKRLFTPLFEGLDVEIFHADTSRGGVHHGFWGLKRLADEIAQLGVDCVADMHGVIKSRVVVAWLALRGVPSKKIIKGRVTKWMHMDGGCNAATQPVKHSVIRYCDTLRRLGYEFADPTIAQKQERPNPMPYQKGEERWIGVAPFSIHEGKRYPLHLVTTLVEMLSNRYDRVFIHSGGGDELEFAKELEGKFTNVVALYAQVKLAEEVNLISMLDCMVTMDSFAMHVASLMATPIVSVWGATHPMLGFTGYCSDPRGVVQLDLTCRPCSTYGNKRCRFGDYHCMKDIAPQMIFDRVAELIAK